MKFFIKGLGYVQMNSDSVTFSGGYEGRLTFKEACELMVYYTYPSVLICLFGFSLFSEVCDEQRKMWEKYESAK